MRKQSDSETLEQLYDLYEQKMYAVAVISLIPASAYAADKWIRMQNSNTGSYGSNLLLTKESTGNEAFTPVKLAATYLPDGSTCHLGYVVDEDMLNQIYMNTDFGEEMHLVDIRR